MLLQRVAEALEAKRQRRPSGRRRGRVAERGGIELAIDQRLDPQTCRIDDLEQHVLRLHHLARHDARRRDDARGRRAQRFRLDADLVQHLPPLAQAFHFGLGVDELALRRDLLFHQDAGAAQPRFRHRDQLLDLAELLEDGGAVGLRQRRLDARQQVAFLHRLSDARQSSVRRHDAAAVDALHQAGAVRVRDHAPDQADGALRLLRRQLLGAHVEQPLRRLRHKDVAVRQPAR